MNLIGRKGPGCGVWSHPSVENGKLQHFDERPTMKYVCMADEEGNEEIFVFPRSVAHSTMADALRYMKASPHPMSPGHVIRTPVSAGFVNIGECTCYGESETLLLKSRPGDTDRLRLQR